MKHLLRRKLQEFQATGKADEEKLFSELCFCILTPQSNSLKCDAAIQELEKRGLLLKGTPEQIAKILKGKARFHNTKAKHLVENRERFMESGKGKPKLKAILLQFSTPEEKRDFLVANVKGIGLKEAGHFLRNTGQAGDLAILDRHILRNLYQLGVIGKPDVKSRKDYLLKEKQMQAFAKKMAIPMQELDLLFWSKETGILHK